MLEIDLHHGKEQEVTSEMFCSKCKSLLKAGTRGYIAFLLDKTILSPDLGVSKYRVQVKWEPVPDYY